MTSKLPSPSTRSVEIEWIAHYRAQAAQMRQWTAEKTGPEARDRLLHLAQQYDRLANEFEARIAALDRAGEASQR